MIGLEQSRANEWWDQQTWQWYHLKWATKEGKLKSPSAKDQAAGVSDSGPHETNYEEELIRSIHSASISTVAKLEIMQHTVARSHKVCISTHGIQIPSLLDLGSEVMLLRQSYFEKHLLPKIQVVTSEKADVLHLFHLTVTNDRTAPC